MKKLKLKLIIMIPFGILIGCFNNNIKYPEITPVPVEGIPPSRVEIDQGWSQEIRQQF